MIEGSESFKAKHIILCNCRGERIHQDLIGRVDEHLKKMAVRVTRLSDLCGLVIQNNEQVSGLFVAGTEYLVIGCYHRTISLLLDKIKRPSDKPFSCKLINLIDLSYEEVLDIINGFSGEVKGDPQYFEITQGTGWQSWYPVIDYSRCNACGQCADFCLFGVYEKTGEGITVLNPQRCKTNCPACARICPSTAIIFPKYKNGGVIGGSDEIDEQAEQQRQGKILRIFCNDLYAALRNRKVKRQSIIREEAMKHALAERGKALNNNLRNEIT
jgi:Pyruvate/2-oxoacid:ferredoxin oxidoreductase delta subunit